MSYSLSPWLKPRFFITGTNRPLAGGLMYTYKAGTTDPATTYSDDAGTTNTNPIVLDSDGQCDLFLDDAVSYRIILKNSAGVTQFDKDRIASLGSTQVQSFNSIAALRLKTGTTAANSAKTLGYYNAGDGGGNAFYWDSTSTETDNSGTIIKPTNVSGAGRWIAILSKSISPRVFGAISNTSTYNSTTAFNSCKDYLYSIGGGDMVIDGTFYIREFLLDKVGVNLIGQYSSSVIKYFTLNTPATDSTSWVMRWDAYNTTIRNITIDGGNKICNLLMIRPSIYGMVRKLRDVNLFNAAGYKASTVGGTYGINQNYGRADITDDVGNHLLTGGKGLMCDLTNGNPAYELDIDGLVVKGFDGICADFGAITDSTISNVVIGGGVYLGMVVKGGNNKFSSVKVYRCNMLNPLDNFATSISKIIPHQSTAAYDNGAVTLSGRNHKFINLESQENGSNGIQIGTTTSPLQSTSIQCLSDGNGGYDTTVSAPVLLAYKRYGVFLKAYYALDLNIMADDFRAKDSYPRQLRAVQILSSGSLPAYASLANLAIFCFYRIADNSGGADFSPLQIGITPSNAVDFVFQIRRVYPAGMAATNFGTGYLVPANERLNMTLTHINQYEVDMGTGVGYDIGGNNSNESSFVINGKAIANTFTAKNKTAGQQAFAVNVQGETYDRLSITNAKISLGNGSSFAGDAVDFLSAGNIGTVSSTSFRAGSGLYNTGHLKFGSTEMWIDTTSSPAIIRVKDSAPASMTDGVTVGSQ